MRKLFLLFTLVLIGLFTLPGTGKAAVTPISGAVDPEISTAASPKWYTIMSSHMTAQDRQNRFMVWDGTRLRTEQFNDGIPKINWKINMYGDWNEVAQTIWYTS
ncbi:hypothetical protein [Bacteroides sp.]